MGAMLSISRQFVARERVRRLASQRSLSTFGRNLYPKVPNKPATRAYAIGTADSSGLDLNKSASSSGVQRGLPTNFAKTVESATKALQRPPSRTGRIPFTLNGV